MALMHTCSFALSLVFFYLIEDGISVLSSTKFALVIFLGKESVAFLKPL